MYSDADSIAPPRLDGCGRGLGGETAAESYLHRAIVDAVANGCDAVHPVWIPRKQAARAVEAAGLMWVGPTAEQVELLGDKMAAKRAAEESGVPRLDYEVAPMAAPADVSMPALVKAAAVVAAEGCASSRG